jgi:hypothetical protein
MFETTNQKFIMDQHAAPLPKTHGSWTDETPLMAPFILSMHAPPFGFQKSIIACLQ